MITVLKPGLLTTVQDEGRPGYRAFGMPVAGALDRDAFSVANLLAGNDPGAAALELTLLGGTFRFDVGAHVALTGADMQPRVDDTAVPRWASFPVAAGQVLTLSGARSGVRTYLAVRGGIDVPRVLGSRATYTRARVGGVDGRALARGDVLRIGPAAPEPGADGPSLLPEALVPRHPRPVALRVLLGPQEDRFTPEGVATLLGAEFTISNRNDRMGYQLEGPAIGHVRGPDIVSDGIVPGSVQVPGNGLPIVMMADCATVGGYTKIATVVSVDLPLLAQARAGERVRFVRCAYAEAVEALRRREAWLGSVREAIAPRATHEGGAA